METKHTKGHWRTGLRNNLAVIVDKKDSTKPTICDCNNMTIPQIEAEANAKLIAAAPELLEALKAADGLIYSLFANGAKKMDGDNQTIDRINNAIKKATE